MKYCITFIAVCAAFCAGSSRTYAVPELQLYVEGGTYDTVSETWIATGDPLKIWAIGNVAGEGGKGAISDVKLSIAYDGSLAPPTITFTPGTTGGYLGFVDLSTPLMPTYLQTVTDGSSPIMGDGGSLPSHGIFGSGVSWQEFLLGDFTLTDSPIADFGGPLPPAPGSPNEGQVNVYTIDVGDFEGLLHLDLYNSYWSEKHGEVSIKAPFSHDAEGIGGGDNEPPSPVVPEPGSLLIWAFGLAVIGGAGLARRMRGRR
jgi:hypothetical protein